MATYNDIRRTQSRDIIQAEQAQAANVEQQMAAQAQEAQEAQVQQMQQQAEEAQFKQAIDAAYQPNQALELYKQASLPQPQVVNEQFLNNSGSQLQDLNQVPVEQQANDDAAFAAYIQSRGGQ